jgi:stage II sporulation protein D
MSRSPASLAFPVALTAALVLAFVAGCMSTQDGPVRRQRRGAPAVEPAGASAYDSPPAPYPASGPASEFDEALLTPGERVPNPPLPSSQPGGATPRDEDTSARPAPPPPEETKNASATRTSVPSVRVVLASVRKAGRAPVIISGGYSLRDARGAEIARGTGLRADLVLGADGAKLGTTSLPEAGAVLKPDTPEDLVVGGHRYPGTLWVGRAGVGDKTGARTAEIRLDLETYLEGVVIGELPPGYPREALRTQAIVARTYVLTQDGAQDPAGIVVEDTGLTDQEFSGIVSNTTLRSAVHEAVSSTRGLVVLGGGRPVRTWYHSTCGGMTCPATVVFHRPAAVAAAARAPGLGGGVACEGCTTSSRYRWKDVRIPGIEVVRAAALTGTLEGFVVAEKTSGGRAASFEVRAGGRVAKVPAGELRLAVGPKLLRSTWLDTAAVVNAADGKGRDLLVSGRGWGHGVGLCQVGARGYAERGWTAERIVAFYYPGAELVRRW